MARIERREARIRRIRAKHRIPMKIQKSQVTGKALKHRYYIGKSENNYRHIGTFLRNNAGDPAIKVSFIVICYRVS